MGFRPGNRRTSTPTPPPPSPTTTTSVRDFSVRPVFKGNRRPVTPPSRVDSDNNRQDPLPFPVGEAILRNDNKEKENRRAGLPRRNSPLTKPSPRTTQAPAKEEENEVLPPLSDTERKSKKQERNNLFKKLLSGRNEAKTTPKPVIDKIPKQKEKMSPLENLFNIIQSDQETSEKPEPSVRVTSSSSSSSSRSVSSSSSSSSSRSSSSSTGGRRKKKKKSA